MQTITPFLWFDREAEQAAKFYVSVFRKKSKILRVSRYGEAGPGPKGAVMLVEFQLDGQRFQALNGGPHYKLTPAFSLVVTCKTQREVDSYWKKLAAGGGQPVQCGWLTDKFGVSWQVVPERLGELLTAKDTARGQRAMAAMLKMTKLDIKALEAAADGVRPKRDASLAY
jgi:predicted 3-demethylubiquinone-9 3-methyltransferase (glyoxalase superfamily)